MTTGSPQAPSTLGLLHKVLYADAAITGLTGLLLAGAAPPLAELLDLPLTLLRYAGLSLLPFAVVVAMSARPVYPSRTAVTRIASYNVAWVTLSLLILLTGMVHPNPLGVLFVLTQAAAVALFAVLQYRFNRPR